MADQPSGIMGNTRTRQDEATTIRSLKKQESSALVSRIVIGVVGIAVASVLAISPLSFFWKLVTALTLIVIGGKLDKVSGHSNIVWYWPQIAKTVGWVTFAAILLSSGIGEWTESKFIKLDESAACAANAECTAQKKAQEELERQQAEASRAQARARRSSTQQPVVYGLGKEAFLVKVTGSFSPIVITPETLIGPIGNFKGTCLEHYIVEGQGKLEIWTRPDIYSEPVKAVLKGAKVVKLGHSGPVAHQFFKASGDSITIGLNRKIAGSCS